MSTSIPGLVKLLKERRKLLEEAKKSPASSPTSIATGTDDKNSDVRPSAGAGAP